MTTTPDHAELLALAERGPCDLCGGTGLNKVSQLWPGYPPPCRACGGAGALAQPEGTRNERTGQ